MYVANNKKPIYIIYYDKGNFVHIKAKSQGEAIECFFIHFTTSLIDKIELSCNEHFDYEW